MAAVASAPGSASRSGAISNAMSRRTWSGARTSPAASSATAKSPSPIRRARPGRACREWAGVCLGRRFRLDPGCGPGCGPGLGRCGPPRRSGQRHRDGAAEPKAKLRGPGLASGGRDSPASVAAFRLASARARRSRASASRSASAAGSNGSTAIGAPVVEPPRLSGVEPVSAATASLVALDTPPLNSRPPQNASPGYAFVLQKVPPGRQQAGGSEPVVAHDGAVVAR